MNREGLINEVAEKVGVTKKETQNILEAFIKTVTDALSRGEKVTLVGFGTFQVVERKARRGVNPQTREKINIPAKKVPKFLPGKNLREKVEGK
ncbi:HU family DNA-binding protein [Candidatus Aerophobetes bacterium]|nr:HU family DNA-binding protein [Candidatus Aerophobetes bacterium]